MIRELTAVESRHEELLERLPEEPARLKDQELESLANDLCDHFGIDRLTLLRFVAAIGEVSREALQEAAQHCLLFQSNG